MIINGDESYDRTGAQISKTELNIKLDDTFSLPNNLYEIEKNLFYQVDEHLHIFYINNHIKSVVQKPFLFSENEYRKYIFKISEEIAKKLIPIRELQNQKMILYHLYDMKDIQNPVKTQNQKHNEINTSTPGNDLGKRIFTWLWNTLK